MEARPDVAFSPTVSLQLFAQPLIPAVHYTSTGRLARPATQGCVRFSEGRGLPSPGGVICVDGQTCVVEGQRQMDCDGDGRYDRSSSEPSYKLRSLRGNGDALSGAPAENRFIVKMSRFLDV